jgi:hypothetical protein
MVRNQHTVADLDALAGPENGPFANVTETSDTQSLAPGVQRQLSPNLGVFADLDSRPVPRQILDRTLDKEPTSLAQRHLSHASLKLGLVQAAFQVFGQ